MYKVIFDISWLFLSFLEEDWSIVFMIFVNLIEIQKFIFLSISYRSVKQIRDSVFPWKGKCFLQVVIILAWLEIFIIQFKSFTHTFLLSFPTNERILRKKAFIIKAIVFSLVLNDRILLWVIIFILDIRIISIFFF